MACCIALTLIVSMLRGAWFFVTGRKPAEVGFAPPAHRPAPGQALATTPAGAPPAPLRPTPLREGRRREVGHQLIALGLTWFGIGVVGMHVFGWFDWAHASMAVDVVFHASGIWLATLGAALLAFPRHSLTRQRHPLTEVTA